MPALTKEGCTQLQDVGSIWAFGDLIIGLEEVRVCGLDYTAEVLTCLFVFNLVRFPNWLLSFMSFEKFKIWRSGRVRFTLRGRKEREGGKMEEGGCSKNLAIWIHVQGPETWGAMQGSGARLSENLGIYRT